MNAKRGEGRAVFIGDRRLFDELFRSQPGNFAAPTVARGKGYHQNCRVAQSGEIITRTCCQQFAQNVTGDGTGTLAG